MKNNTKGSTLVSTMVAFVILMLGLAMVTTAVVATTSSMGKANISRQLVHKAENAYYRDEDELNREKKIQYKFAAEGTGLNGATGFILQQTNDGGRFFLPGKAMEYKAEVVNDAGNPGYRILFFEK